MNNCYISGLMEKEELRPLIEKTGAGLETIQFSVAENLDNFEETMRTEKEKLKYLGNPGLIIHGPFLDLNPMCYDSLVKRATFERFDAAYKAAELLGAEKVIFHSCLVPTVYFLEGWADRMVSFWQEFLDGRSGITVCMENVLDREIAPVLEVAEKVGHPDFGICLDAAHAHCYSPYSVMEWAKRLNGYIRHVHLHDNDKSWDTHQALGKGTIPWHELLSTICTGNPDVSFTVECRTPEDVLESFKVIRKENING